MIEEIRNIPNSNKDIKSFGIVIGIILFVVTGLLMHFSKEYYHLVAIIASIFIVLGFTLPPLLKANLLCLDDICCYSWLDNDQSSFELYILLNYNTNWFVHKVNWSRFSGIEKKKTDSYWNDRNSLEELNQNYEKQF